MRNIFKISLLTITVLSMIYLMTFYKPLPIPNPRKSYIKQEQNVGQYNVYLIEGRNATQFYFSNGEMPRVYRINFDGEYRLFIYSGIDTSNYNDVGYNILIDNEYISYEEAVENEYITIKEIFETDFGKR